MSASVRRKNRRRRKRRRLIRNILIAILAAVLLAAGIFSTVRQKSANAASLPSAYDLACENGAEDLDSFALMKAEPFASNLVVSDANVNTDQLKLAHDDEQALLFDLDKQEALYANEIYREIYPASITKIMTALLCLENGDLSQTVTMTEADFDLEEDAQVSDLKAGDTVTLDQLFHLLVIYSANDAAMAIARTIGGSVDKFVEMMNTRAQELGMTETHFANPDGLQDENHETSVYDDYLMMNAVYQHSEYTEASQMNGYQTKVQHADGTTGTISEYATDEFITGTYGLPNGIRILASKTGTTSEAGSCLALVVQSQSGGTYMAILMGAWNTEDLYTEMISLLSLIGS